MAPPVHPLLAAARDRSDAAALIAIALDCRAALDQGRYCECDAPNLDGGLMCSACLLRNRTAEIAAVREICGPHDFTPRTSGSGLMCEVCTGWEDDTRHHGGAIVGRTSWGEPVPPVTGEGQN